jgi:HEAT repeat protein
MERPFLYTIAPVLRHVGTPTLPLITLLVLAAVMTTPVFSQPADPDGIDSIEEESEEPPQKTTERPGKPESPEKRKEALSVLKNRILYSSSTDRRNAIRDLKLLKKEEQSSFYDDLVLIVKTDRDASVREAALRFLAEGAVATEKAKEAYLAGLDDTDRNVRLEALKGIRKIELKEAADRLARLVSESQLNENDAVIHTAIRTLGGLQYTSPGFTERLLEALDNPETDLESRRSILLYAGSVRNAQMQEKLLTIVADADADLVMRSYAANSLGKIAAKDNGMKENRERSIKAMQAVLDEIRNIRDSRQRARMNMLKQQAILALIRMGDDSVKDELQAAAQDDDASMRLRAIRYIGELKLKEYRNLVEFKSKHDESAKVRKEAERVLKEL